MDPTTNLHATASEDRLQRGAPAAPPQPGDEEAADAARMREAEDMLGEELEEVKLTCKGGTVVLVHMDLFHRSTRRLPEAWRPLFVLRDCVRMVEPAGPSWRSAPGGEMQGWGIRMIWGVAAPRFRPFFAHFPPSLARSLRLGARKPGSAKRRRKNGGKRAKNGVETGVSDPYIRMPQP